jgi:hypothetical protein
VGLPLHLPILAELWVTLSLRFRGTVADTLPPNQFKNIDGGTPFEEWVARPLASERGRTDVMRIPPKVALQSHHMELKRLITHFTLMTSPSLGWACSAPHGRIGLPRLLLAGSHTACCDSDFLDEISVLPVGALRFGLC